jgi:hypothetical protein
MVRIMVFNASFNVCVRTYVRACVGFFSFEGIVEFNVTLNNISAISWRSVLLKVILVYFNIIFQFKRGNCDPIVVGFIINYAIRVYNQQFESRTDEMYSIQYFNIYTHIYISIIFIVFNATFNNISVLSCWSVLLVKENGGPGEYHSRPRPSHF